MRYRTSKENVAQLLFFRIGSNSSCKEVEDYIKYSAKKLNEWDIIQSDDLAHFRKNWCRITASYKALDARES